MAREGQAERQGGQGHKRSAGAIATAAACTCTSPSSATNRGSIASAFAASSHHGARLLSEGEPQGSPHQARRRAQAPRQQHRSDHRARLDAPGRSRVVDGDAGRRGLRRGDGEGMENQTVRRARSGRGWRHTSIRSLATCRLPTSGLPRSSRCWSRSGPTSDRRQIAFASILRTPSTGRSPKATARTKATRPRSSDCNSRCRSPNTRSRIILHCHTARPRASSRNCASRTASRPGRSNSSC